MANKLRSKDFKKLGIESNKTISIVMAILKKYYKHKTAEMNLEMINKVKSSPENYLKDKILNKIASEFYQPMNLEKEEIKLQEEEIELNVFGRPLIKSNAYQQIDSHLGYGLPIGGVLATDNAVIPYAIGMDIGCRMSLTLYDVTERFFKMHELEQYGIWIS